MTSIYNIILKLFQKNKLKSIFGLLAGKKFKPIYNKYLEISIKYLYYIV